MTALKPIPIVPNGLRYWVLADVKEETTITVGDTVLTGSSESKDPPLAGRIAATGDAPCKYKIGDYIVFGAYAGNVHNLNGIDYTVLHEEEILGRIVEDPAQ